MEDPYGIEMIRLVGLIQTAVQLNSGAKAQKVAAQQIFS